MPDDRNHLLGRGVWRAPWLGPDGELVLIAVTRDHRLDGSPTFVPHGTSEDSVTRALASRLNRADPPLKVI